MKHDYTDEQIQAAIDGTMTIETLKTELREFITLSETITPGRWVKGWNIVGNGKDKDVCFAPMRNPTLTSIDWPTDAAFIARSRNISPTMAKMLLVAVEGLGRLYDDTEGYADGAPDASGHDRLCNEVSHAAKHQLQQLLKLWEETM